MPINGFCTRNCHLVFHILPFGPSNVPDLFISIMNSILQWYLDILLLVCLYDNISNTNEEEHLEYLRCVLDKLQKGMFYGYISKCEFMKEKSSI